MTLQTCSQPLLAAAGEYRRPSFWRRLLDAITLSCRLRAEQEIVRHLGHHQGEHHDEFTRALERRFLGSACSGEVGTGSPTRTCATE
jgi:hypothetical protein